MKAKGYKLPAEGQARFEPCLKLSENGWLLTFEDIRNVKGERVVERTGGYPPKTVLKIAQRLKEGVEYRFADVLYDIPKDVLAFIHANADELIAKVSKILDNSKTVT